MSKLNQNQGNESECEKDREKLKHLSPERVNNDTISVYSSLSARGKANAW